MSLPVLVKFKLRRDTAANWALENPTLLDGEPGLETDTLLIKYGDGISDWDSLEYAPPYLAPGFVNNSHLADVPTSTFKGRTTAATGIVEDLSAAQAMTLLPLFTSLLKGVVPPSTGGTAKFLRADGTWATLGSMSTQNQSAVNIGGGSATLSSFLLSAASPLLEVRSSLTSAPFGIKFATGATQEALITQQSNSAELTISTGRSIGWGGKIKFITDTVEKWNIGSVGHFIPGADNLHNVGSAFFRVKEVFAAAGTINTSDSRFKESIESIPDEWLKAWADVEWVRYRFVGGKRWHVGLVAQRIKEVFEKHGLDALELGLICYDEWPTQEAKKAKKNRRGKVAEVEQPFILGGNRWGLRYDECFALEAAWQREELAQLRSLLNK